MVVADLPGLLKRAHKSFDLDYEFLRQTERCSTLLKQTIFRFKLYSFSPKIDSVLWCKSTLRVVNGSLHNLNLSLKLFILNFELFPSEIAEKQYVVAFNKISFQDVYEKWPMLKESLGALRIIGLHVSQKQRQRRRHMLNNKLAVRVC